MFEINITLEGLVGAMIGGAASLLGTIVTLRYNMRTESMKRALPYLYERKGKFEKMLDECSVGDVEQPQDEKDLRTIELEYDKISWILRYKAHYFCGVEDFKKLRKDMKDINDINIQGMNERQITYFKQDFNDKVRELLCRELSDITKRIDGICKQGKSTP